MTGVRSERGRRNGYILLSAVTAALSVLIMLLLTNGRIDVFLADDSIMQQEPVIRASLDRLLETGRMPLVDFFQHKKFDSFGAGIYGLYNPLMIVAYLLSRFLFASRFGVISVYVVMLFALGNVCMALLLRRLGFGLKVTALVVLAYAGTSSFAIYGYYYFMFNSYFFIPFLLLVMVLSGRGRLSWFAHGTALAFGVLLGHVQYAVYYFFLYCIVMAVRAAEEGAVWLGRTAVNAAVGVGLTIPHLVLLMRGAANRSFIFSWVDEFTARPVYPGGFLSRFCLPLYLNRSTWNREWMPVDEFYRLSTSQVYMGILLPLALLFLIWGLWKKVKGTDGETAGRLFKRIGLLWGLLLPLLALLLFVIFPMGGRMTDKGDELKALLLLGLLGGYLLCFVMFTASSEPGAGDFPSLAWGSGFAALVFFLFSIGDVGGVSVFLSQLPVIKGFRYLYKCTVVIIPLLALPAACMLKLLMSGGGRRRAAVLTAAALGLVGLTNSWYIYNGGFHPYMNNPRYEYNDGTDYVALVKGRMEELGLDKDNYRFAAVVEGQDLDSLVENSSADCYEKLTKNMSTAVGAFTLMGYDNSFTKESYLQSDAIFTDAVLNGQFTNAILGPSIFEGLNAMETDDPYVRNFAGQLRQNAVKYFLVDEDGEASLGELTRLIERIPGLSVERVEPFVGHTLVVEIGGVDSLCRDREGKPLELVPAIDELRFRTDGGTVGPITLSFTYDAHYQAVFTDEEGGRRMLPVSRNEENYTVIEPGAAGAEGEISLTFRSAVCTAAKAATLLIVLLLTVVCLLLSRTKNEKSYGERRQA